MGWQLRVTDGTIRVELEPVVRQGKHQVAAIYPSS